MSPNTTPGKSSEITAAKAVSSATSAEVASFKNLPGISEPMLAVLAKHGFVTPTPIQTRVISHGILGKDIIGIAQTGTGKTLAFGIPMIERIVMDRAAKKESRG